MRVCLIEQLSSMYNYQKIEKERVWGRETEREKERRQKGEKKEGGDGRKERKRQYTCIYGN